MTLGNVSTDVGLPQPSWAEEDLQYIRNCPVCDSPEREIFLTGVDDKVFGIGGNGWTFLKCLHCTTLYLNPRPNESSIGRAYASYYTHSLPSYDHNQFFWRHDNFKARLMTGYINKKYGYRFEKSIKVGYAALMFRRGLRLAIDYSMAHLPAPKSTSSKLLDIGCGNGHFLVLAKALGYETMGIEPDPTAAAHGRENGLNIRVGLLPDESFDEGNFEHITMSHVVEHLHKPREALAQCFDMLKSGGRIWISQPNAGARGLAEFGPNWRGLEAPRHTVLFNLSSLSGLLAEIGFAQIRQLPPEEVAEFYYQQSFAMSQGIMPYAAMPNDSEMEHKAALANREARRDWSRSESLTVTALRP